MSQWETVDHSSLKTNQGVIILLGLVSFVTNLPWLALLVGLLMLLGTLTGKPAFFPVYRLLRRSGLMKPELLVDNPEPHRFAQGFGGVVMLLGGIVLAVGHPIVGWWLVWLVIALAGLNLFAGFCVGCAVYYWLNRLRVPGFVKVPPPDTFPGMRPKRGAK